MNAPGTRKRTTLATLDRDVCVQRKGGTPPRAMAAPLGADLLAQIDLLRGRVRKRGLFALIQPQERRGKPEVAAAAFDAGAPVQSVGYYSDVVAASMGMPVGSWRAFTYNADDDPATAAFAVESFDVGPPAVESQPPAMEPSYVIEPTADMTPAPVRAPAYAPEPAPQVEIPVAAALSAGQQEDGVLGLDLSSASATDREDAEQFEREIQAILSGRTARAMPQASSAPPPASEVPAPAVLRPHDVFEQMGQNMSYATAFNLPPMELRRRFDDIEQAIAGEEQAELRKQNDVSLELSDADFVANLGAPPEPPPTLPDIVVTPVKTPAGSPGDATATVEEAARTVVTVAPPADEASQPPSTIETNDSARSGRQTS